MVLGKYGLATLFITTLPTATLPSYGSIPASTYIIAAIISNSDVVYEPPELPPELPLELSPELPPEFPLELPELLFWFLMDSR